MSAIRKLPASLVNRIAAGECVERPASVVKELVENALDAGAGEIEILIEAGGRERICVRDDGRGIARDDLPLAVEPHATSKIASDDDLFRIRTLGFRGEALASIASVSRLEITSRTADSDVAFRLRVEGGQVGQPEPCAAPPGTTVDVRDLFYCVPARAKFLRTAQTEMGHITEQLARLALPHPRVAFRLTHGRRVVHELPATDTIRERIASFYTDALAAGLLPVHRESGPLRIEGWIAPPAESRGSGKWEYVFVNGRYVRDRFVSHAVREAYRSLIEPGRYPVVFLFIEIDPAAVDVNVHPTKIEVRWRDSNFVHSQVLLALRERLSREKLDHALAPADEDQRRERIRQAMVDFFLHSRPQTAPEPASRPQSGATPRPATPAAEHPPADALELRAQPVQPALPIGVEPPAVEPAPLERAEASTAFERRPVAVQVHNMFIVAETPDGLLIIDQHALHERILYEQLRERIAAWPLESQRLLMPEMIEVPGDRLAVLEEHAGLLRRLGIELTPAGPQTVALQAFPTFLGERVDRPAFVRDLLDRLSEAGRRPDAETLIHEVLDMMACKAAVKFGDPLTDDEIHALLAQRERAERSSHCPHGRPTTLHLTLRELQRQFHRR